MRKTVTGLLFMLLPVLAGTAAAQVPDFFSFFQGFSLGDIGGPEEPFSGDIQGVAGTRGSAWFDRVSLNELGAAFPGGLHAGGSVTLAGCVERGGIEAGGWVELGAPFEPRLGSHVVFTARPGMNVFHLPADALNGVSLVTIVGPASATVVINIVGAEVEIAELLRLRGDGAFTLPNSRRRRYHHGDLIRVGRRDPVPVCPVPGSRDGAEPRSQPRAG
jgi:hypothetical protein